jgi:hypothetical protein
VALSLGEQIAQRVELVGDGLYAGLYRREPLYDFPVQVAGGLVVLVTQHCAPHFAQTL